MTSTSWPELLQQQLHFYDKADEISLRRLPFNPDERNYTSMRRDSPFDSIGIEKEKRGNEDETDDTSGSTSEKNDDNHSTQDCSTMKLQQLLDNQDKTNKARVYRAQWEGLTVVAKVFEKSTACYNPDNGGQNSGDYECAREAHAYHLLQTDNAVSPHFVKCHGLFEAKVPFVGRDKYLTVILLEHFDGFTLDAIQSPNALPRSVRLEILQRTIRAARHAYQQGVINNSLYKRNVLVGKADLTIRLIDFGNWAVAQYSTVKLQSPYSQPSGVTGNSVDVSEWDFYVARILNHLKSFTEDISMTDLHVATHDHDSSRESEKNGDRMDEDVNGD